MKDSSGCFYIFILIAMIAASIIFTYLIAVSNLPDWFKFWILK